MKSFYQPYLKKYDLPSYEDLHREFEIGKMEIKNDVFVLIDILRAMNNKLGFLCSTLEPAVNPPNPTMHSMVETSNIDDNTKQQIYNDLKWFSQLYHENMILEFSSEEKVALRINELWNQWNEIRTKAIYCLQEVALAWRKNNVINQQPQGILG
jgi:hypothetical protein